MSDVSEQAKALADELHWTTEVGRQIAQGAIDVGWVHRDSLVAEGWTPPSKPVDPTEALVAAAYRWAASRCYQPGEEGAEADLWFKVRAHRTPPPDPCKTIARELYKAVWGDTAVYGSPAHTDLLAAVRRLLTADEARAIAGRIEGEP